MIWANSSNIAGIGDFEAGNGGWSFATFAPAAGTFAIESANPAQGAKFAHAHISAIGAGRWYANLAQNGSYFPIVANQPYAVTFWARVGQARSVDVILSDGGGAVYGSVSLPLTTSWKRYQVAYYPTSSGVNGRFRFDRAR